MLTEKDIAPLGYRCDDGRCDWPRLAVDMRKHGVAELRFDESGHFIHIRLTDTEPPADS
jgi:hypothetical protein